jgi:iron complex outermembrane receptor protein
MKRNSLILLLLFPFSMTTPLAIAQDDSEDSGMLEEVLVTATRRGESDIMTTPLAITALSGEETEKFAIRDLNDIAVSIPGLSNGSVSGFNSAQFSMRGTTETSIIIYKESPVGVTLDEFVVPVLQTANLEMFDIEAVEVLRGPQGTLFGKNTTGGVINVRTKRPVLGENTVDLRLSAGDWGTRKTNLALNIGGDTAAFRFAAMNLKSDGYYKNGAAWGPIVGGLDHGGESGVGDGRDLGGSDVVSARAKVLWSPNEDTNLTFQYEYIRDKGDSPPIVSDSVNGVYFATFWGLPGHDTSRDPLDQAGSSLRNAFGVDIPGGHTVDVDGIYLNGDYAINDDLTLYFNAGTREQISRLPSSYGGSSSPVSLFDATRDDNRNTSQFEARVASNTGSGFDWVAGVFSQKDNADFCVMQIVGMLDGFGLGTPDGTFNNLPLLLCNAQRAEAQALFADGTWTVNDRFRITAGVRYSDEEKAWAGRSRGPTLNGDLVLNQISEPIEGADFARFPEGVQRHSDSWSEPTYRLIFDYDISDDLFGFFGYSRGFKSGGYNDQTGTILNPIPALGLEPVFPEIADSFEGGIKSTFADGRGTISVNAYFVEYSDAQRTLNASFPSGQETLFFNAAEMTVKGVDIEGAYKASDNFTLRYNLAYMDASYDKFEADTNFDGTIDVDLSNNPVTRAPEMMGSFSGTWTSSLNNGGGLQVDLRYSYEDESISSYSDLGPGFNTILQERNLLDASITYHAPDDKFYFKVLGSNLTDDRYRTGSLDVSGIWVMSAYGAPKYFGVEFGTNFNF